MSAIVAYQVFAVVLVILFGGTLVTVEKLKAIILRYEALLREHGIPHSRREHGPKGFYTS